MHTLQTTLAIASEYTRQRSFQSTPGLSAEANAHAYTAAETLYSVAADIYGTSPERIKVILGKSLADMRALNRLPIPYTFASEDELRARTVIILAEAFPHEKIDDATLNGLRDAAYDPDYS